MAGIMMKKRGSQPDAQETAPSDTAVPANVSTCRRTRACHPQFSQALPALGARAHLMSVDFSNPITGFGRQGPAKSSERLR